jgi:L-alanine-DL-glutamate epimerase-like enolase superfamily enzyme
VTVVEALEVTACTVPTDRPESDGTLEWDATTIVVVQARGGGRRGIGYTYGSAAAGAVVAGALRGVVVGRPALEVPAAWAAMQAAVRNDGRVGLAAMAISAVDVALWDLAARLLNVPLSRLLGPFHDAVPVYGSGGFTSYAPEALAAQLGGWVSRGIPRVKMKVGRDPDRDEERVRVAREAIGAGAELFVDANGAYARKEALSWAERYGGLGVTYFEEPVSSDDLDGLALVRDRAPAGMAIAAGEYGYDLPYFARMVGAVDVQQADVTRCGGITALVRVGALCQAHGVPFSAHCAPALSAHACCAIAPLAHLEYFHDHVRVEELLFDGTLSPDGGVLRPDPGRPGLGLELRLEQLERHAVWHDGG